MNNTLVVKNMDGKDIKINVVDIIEDTQSNKQYICYSIEDMDNIFVSNLVKNSDGYCLDTVTEEEKNNIEQVMSQEIDGESNEWY